MDQAAVHHFLTSSFQGLDFVEHNDDFYYFYNPSELTKDHRFPFATLVTGDRHDQVSNLDRPGVFRLNVGVSKETYLGLFGQLAPKANAEGIIDSGHDFTALDVLLPHPVYASMYWVSVLNPGEATWPTVEKLLDEAYAAAKKKREAKEEPAE